MSVARIQKMRLAPRRTKRVSLEGACAPQGYLFSNVGPAGGVFFLFSVIPSVFRYGWIDRGRPRNFSIEIETSREWPGS